MIGETSGKMIWKTSTFGSATQPSAPLSRRNSAERCFHAACRVPNIQRKRCLTKSRTRCGASVRASAESA